MLETATMIYGTIVFFVYFVTGLAAANNDCPEKIDNFYDWLFYGAFWIIIVIKYFIKFIIKLFR